jgi:hypothetical protein
VRSGSTVNAVITAACEMLRFCARTGMVEAVVADQLSEPRWLRFTPPGFDAGESGQFRSAHARTLKARAHTPFPEALTAEQVTVVLGCSIPSRCLPANLARIQRISRSHAWWSTASNSALDTPYRK